MIFSTHVLMGFWKHAKSHFRHKKLALVEDGNDSSSDTHIFRAFYKALTRALADQKNLKSAFLAY